MNLAATISSISSTEPRPALVWTAPFDASPEPSHERLRVSLSSHIAQVPQTMFFSNQMINSTFCLLSGNVRDDSQCVVPVVRKGHHGCSRTDLVFHREIELW